MNTVKIQDLDTTSTVNGGDYLPVNVNDSTTGYVITKKATISTIAKCIRSQISSNLSIEDFGLKSASQMDPIGLLENFVQRGDHKLALYYSSLALSTKYDLDNHIISVANDCLSSKNLNNYVLKANANASYECPAGQAMIGLVLSEGKVIAIKTTNLQALLPVDSELNSYSSYPLQNKVITDELNKLVKKDDATSSYPEQTNYYISGIEQKDGKITKVYRQPLTKQSIDDTVDDTSGNPPSGQAVSDKIYNDISESEQKASNTYVSKSYATSYNYAQSGSYVTSITQKDGKITSIGLTTLPSNTLNAEDGYYITGITQQNGKITNILTKAIPAATTTVAPASVTVDSAMSESSTNPVLNKAITKALNDIKAASTSQDTALKQVLDTLYPVGSLYLSINKYRTTCPLQDLGVGTWSKLPAGFSLQTTTDKSVAGNTVTAGLPSFPTLQASTNVSSGTIKLGTITTSAAGSHGHTATMSGNTGSNNGGSSSVTLTGTTGAAGGHSHSAGSLSTKSGGFHSHNVSVGCGSCSCSTLNSIKNSHVSNASSYATSSDGGHTHSMTGSTSAQPDHTHSVNLTGTASVGSHTHPMSGTVSISNADSHTHTITGNVIVSNITASTSITSNNIPALYGKSSTVQPAAINVVAWYRVS